MQNISGRDHNNNNAMKESPSSVVGSHVIGARESFASGLTLPLAFRRAQLESLLALLNNHEEDLVAALGHDLGRPPFETRMAEVDFVRNDIRYALIHLESWLAPEKASKTLASLFDEVLIRREPLGLVLIIGTWNYPIQVLLTPLVGAIAAGNAVILKPSELAAETGRLLASLIPKYLDPLVHRVVLGGSETTQVLLQHRFDHIFFTGSSRVGKIVHEAAARHMTPVTLECGGKSPVYLDDSVPDMEIAAKRILWGKSLNAGQTCVAPDYLLCTRKVQQKFLIAARKVLSQFHKSHPLSSGDLSKIISADQYNRLKKLIQSSGTVSLGGEMDDAEQRIAPTILTDVTLRDPIMSQEIFGPILPIVNVESIDEAINLINSRDKPLSLYVFTGRESVTKRFIAETTSGSFVANDVMLHLSVPSLPFGGVGPSGFGRYHGKWTFETFSHAKSILIRNYNPILEWVASKRYPPYSESHLRRLGRLLKVRKYPFPMPPNVERYLLFAFGFVSCAILDQALSTWATDYKSPLTFFA